MSSFHFDDDAFRQVADEAVQRAAEEQTRDLDALRQQYTGQPLDVIRPALQHLFVGYGGSITEPELSEWAQLIHDGTRIEMVADDVDGNG